MRVEGSADRFEPVEVFAGPETAIASPAFEGSNVFRIAALSTILGGDRKLVQGMEQDLLALGFSAALSAGDGRWSGVDAAESVIGLRDQLFTADIPGGDRIALWERVNQVMTPQAATGFMLAVLGSILERESTAAAAALWRQISQARPKLFSRRYWRPYFREWWFDLQELDLLEPSWWPLAGAPPGFPDLEADPDEFEVADWSSQAWSRVYERTIFRLRDGDDEIALIGLLALFRLNGALRSPDRIVRSLASAAFLPLDAPDKAAVVPPSSRQKKRAWRRVSTMIHGTRGYMGDWWRPEGDFFEFIRDPYRPNLYEGGARHSWSGKWSRQHRERAGREFREWAEDSRVAPRELQTVFAHSYGGEVAARAVIAGAPINELVLLSAPVTSHVEVAAGSNVRIVDIRLKRDPVLLLARIRDRLKQHLPERPNVTEVILKQWSLDHGASHRPEAWQIEKVAEQGGI